MFKKLPIKQQSTTYVYVAREHGREHGRKKKIKSQVYASQ
jgi:hypothetical protein